MEPLETGEIRWTDSAKALTARVRGMDRVSYQAIDWHVDDGLLRLTLDRAEQMNAFTLQMGEELQDAFKRASLDDNVRAVLVTGAGRAFCAGMDLSGTGNAFGTDASLRPTLADLRDRLDDPEVARGVRDPAGKLTLEILACRKPVVAAVNGAAVGVGATMLLAMDFRLASTAARIGFVFGRLGIIPEGCSTWLLPRLVGLQQAMEWLYTADIIAPDEALRGGLLRSIHEPDLLLAEAEAFARRLVRDRSPVATALTRQMLLRNGAASSALEVHRIESLALFYTSIADGTEGVAAFLEKRDPAFASKASQMPEFYGEWTGDDA